MLALLPDKWCGTSVADPCRARSAAMRPYADAALIMMATLVSSIAALALADVSIRRLRPAALTRQFRNMPHHLAPGRGAAMIITGAEALLNRTGVVLLGGSEKQERPGSTISSSILLSCVVLPRTAINILLCANDLNPYSHGGIKRRCRRL